jgi:excisionase family DNA binding protein
MPIDINGTKYYTPTEAAKKLKISVGMLRYLRNEGRIEGTFTGRSYLFTEKQIADADLTPKKTGPKPKVDIDSRSLMLMGDELQEVA